MHAANVTEVTFAALIDRGMSVTMNSLNRSRATHARTEVAREIIRCSRTRCFVARDNWHHHQRRSWGQCRARCHHTTCCIRAGATVPTRRHPP